MKDSVHGRPYIAVIGDIKDSRNHADRNGLQLRLQGALEGVNREYGKQIASRFMITLGDEFQGLFAAGPGAVFAVDRIERELYPVQIRFGIGVGEITTDIDAAMPLGADGPAYYSARNMIDALKAAEKKKMDPKANVRIEIQGDPAVSELMNAVFALLSAAKADWTERQVVIMNAYLACGGTQEEAAKRLGIDQSTLQKALAAANFYACRKALEAVANALAGMEE